MPWFKKEVDFIGKKALERIKNEPIKNKLELFSLTKSQPGKPLLMHDEPTFYKDKIVGYTTSSNSLL